MVRRVLLKCFLGISALPVDIQPRQYIEKREGVIAVTHAFWHTNQPQLNVFVIFHHVPIEVPCI